MAIYAIFAVHSMEIWMKNWHEPIQGNMQFQASSKGLKRGVYYILNFDWRDKLMAGVPFTLLVFGPYPIFNFSEGREEKQILFERPQVHKFQLG